MARRKVAKKAATKAARKPAKKVAKKVARKPAKKVVKKAARKRAPAAKASPPAPRVGMITHTELASTNPGATRQWCASVLGWTFGPPMPTAAGPYHMWRFANDTGGGIRANNPPEAPGSIPYIEVASIQTAYAKALMAGASEMLAPEELPGGMGWIAIVAAPGGVAFGFWAPK